MAYSDLIVYFKVNFIDIKKIDSLMCRDDLRDVFIINIILF